MSFARSNEYSPAAEGGLIRPLDKDRIHRFLKPKAVAVVGASERQVRAGNAIKPMLEAGVDVYLVNPNRPEAFGVKTHPSVADIGKPMDAVLCLVSAELAVDAVAEADATGAGGA